MPPVSHLQTRTSVKPTYSYGYGLVLVSFGWIFTLIYWWQLPPQIPLFYSLPFGNSQLSVKLWYLLLPCLSTLIWFSYYLLSKMKTNVVIYTHILKWLHLTGLVLVTLALIHIVLVVL